MQLCAESSSIWIVNKKWRTAPQNLSMSLYPNSVSQLVLACSGVKRGLPGVPSYDSTQMKVIPHI